MHALSILVLVLGPLHRPPAEQNILPADLGLTLENFLKTWGVIGGIEWLGVQPALDTIQNGINDNWICRKLLTDFSKIFFHGCNPLAAVWGRTLKKMVEILNGSVT